MGKMNECTTGSTNILSGCTNIRYSTKYGTLYEG